MATDNFDPRFDAAYQRGYEAAIPDDSAPSTRGGFNPWLLVLWLLALGLTIGGAWAGWQAQVMFAAPNPDSVEDFYVIPAVLAEFAPWMVVVGLVAVVAAVFLHAQRWSERDD